MLPSLAESLSPEEPETPKKPPAPPRNAWYRDMTNCRVLATRMLKDMVATMKNGLPDDEAMRHDRIHGVKNGMVHTLTAISTMLMKLHAFERENRADDGAAPQIALLLPEDDTIIKQYVESREAR